MILNVADWFSAKHQYENPVTGEYFVTNHEKKIIVRMERSKYRFKKWGIWRGEWVLTIYGRNGNTVRLSGMNKKRVNIAADRLVRLMILCDLTDENPIFSPPNGVEVQ